MSRRSTITATIAAVIAFTALAAASPAAATDDPQYTTVAWVIDNPDNIWQPEQRTTLEQTITGPAVDFAGVQALLGCGRYYQLDGYIAGPTTDALIAGGVLYGPNNPAELLADGAPGTEATNGTPYIYFSSPDCTETVCADAFTQTTTTYRWTWDGAAVVRTDTGSTTATLSEADAIAAGCYTPPVIDPPLLVGDAVVADELAYTGTDDLWLMPLGAALVVVSLLLLLIPTIARRKGI